MHHLIAHIAANPWLSLTEVGLWPIIVWSAKVYVTEAFHPTVSQRNPTKKEVGS